MTMFQGVAKTSAAFRLMQQMGWEEGNGLGKDEQGMKQHLRVKKLQEHAGVGLEDSKAHKWALNTVEYDSILRDLKVVSAAAAVKKDSNTEGDNDTDIDVEEQPKVRKIARPQGRYKRREQCKVVGDYSKTDLEAILGADAGKTEVSRNPQESQPDKVVMKIVAPSVVEPEAVKQILDVKEGASRPEKACKLKKGSESDTEQKKVVKHIEEEMSDDDCPSLPAYPDDWWGKKYGFVSAGALGSASGAKKVERAAFREEDQENLYIKVKDNASTSRRGLGIGDKPRKFEHGDWKGQKKTLDSGSDEETPDICLAVQINDSRKKEKKRQRAQTLEMKVISDSEQAKNLGNDEEIVARSVAREHKLLLKKERKRKRALEREAKRNADCEQVKSSGNAEEIASEFAAQENVEVLKKEKKKQRAQDRETKRGADGEQSNRVDNDAGLLISGIVPESNDALKKERKRQRAHDRETKSTSGGEPTKSSKRIVGNQATLISEQAPVRTVKVYG